MGFLQQILYSVQAIPCNHRGVGALSAGYWQMLLYHLFFGNFGGYGLVILSCLEGFFIQFIPIYFKTFKYFPARSDLFRVDGSESLLST